MSWFFPDEDAYLAVLEPEQADLSRAQRQAALRVRAAFHDLLNRWGPVNAQRPRQLARFAELVARITPDLSKSAQARNYGHLMDALGRGLDPLKPDRAAVDAFVAAARSGELPEWERASYAAQEPGKGGAEDLPMVQGLLRDPRNGEGGKLGRYAASLAGEGASPPYSEDEAENLDEGMAEHPVTRWLLAREPDLFRDRQQALLPALWLHTMVAPHHAALGGAPPPFPDASPILEREGLGLAKGGRPLPVTSRVLRALEAFRLRYGVPLATALFHQHLAPVLLAQAEESVEKFERHIISLRQAYQELRRAEYETRVKQPLVHFMGRAVLAGRAQAEGAEYHLLHDRGDAYVATECVPANHYDVDPAQVSEGEGQLFALPKSKEGTHFRVVEPIREVTDGKLDADAHGVALYNTSPEQRALIHGADVASWGADVKQDHLSSGRWVRSGAGALAFLKSGSEGAENEAIFYNLARDRFGIGGYVPPTAVFDHPLEGRRYSLQEQVRGEHVLSRRGGNLVSPGHPSAEQRDVLERLGRSGELDKLALVDGFVGMADRHRLNYLYVPGGIRLIDNELAFGYRSKVVPHYWDDYLDANEHEDRRGQNLPPETQAWCAALDSDAVEQDLHRYGRHDEAPDVAARIRAVQDILRRSGGRVSRHQIWQTIRSAA